MGEGKPASLTLLCTARLEHEIWTECKEYTSVPMKHLSIFYLYCANLESVYLIHLLKMSKNRKLESGYCNNFKGISNMYLIRIELRFFTLILPVLEMPPSSPHRILYMLTYQRSQLYLGNTTPQETFSAVISPGSSYISLNIHALNFTFKTLTVTQSNGLKCPVDSVRGFRFLYVWFSGEQFKIASEFGVMRHCVCAPSRF